MELTAAVILERIFTTVNPVTGSTPPPVMAWVVFENGTAYFTAPTDALPADASSEALVAAALGAFDELGPAVAGTSSADFDPVRLDGWFPDEPVWFVAFDHPAIATLVVTDAEPLVVGLLGRQCRQDDFAARTVACVRRFDGSLA